MSTLGMSLAKHAALVCGCALACSNAAADQQSTQFKVKVNLVANAATNVPANPSSVFCSSTNAPGSFGATVTVVCSTGAQVAINAPAAGGAPWRPAHGGAYQYISYLARAGSGVAVADIYSLAGTITTWRTVNLNERSYTEMTVSW
jgi:hypothetical protein